MQRFTDIDSAHRFVLQRRARGESVGLVPTMGALHEGHFSLARQSKETCDHTVATIFVNPTQFAPGEDLEKYPRTLESDCRGLSNLGVDAVFLPGKSIMYPDGFSTMVGVPEVGRTLEGKCRPTHFEGVTTIVLKLFHILPTSHAFFGRKDYQQFCVIRQMVRDLNVPMEIIPCETVREPDGLALSSRNRYLSESERQRALSLSQALNRAGELAASGETDIERLQLEMRRVLVGVNDTPGVDKIEYATIVHADTLAPLDRLVSPSVALIAAFVGNTRLIDNRTLTD